MKKNKGYTVIEIVVSSAIFLMVTLSYVEASILLRDACYGSIIAQGLQRDANIIMGCIVERGPGEASYKSGLRSAASCNIPTGSDPLDSKITFTGIDGYTRVYYLEKGSGRIIYQSPGILGGTKTVYTAPPGTEISLKFVPVSVYRTWTAPAVIYVPYDSETVRVYIALSRTVRGKRYVGSLSDWVNLKNVPK